MDWTTPLKSQQQDFCHRLESGQLFLSEQENMYSEMTVVKEKQLELIVSHCQEKTAKYENIYSPDQIFPHIFTQKLSEEALIILVLIKISLILLSKKVNIILILRQIKVMR